MCVLLQQVNVPTNAKCAKKVSAIEANSTDIPDDTPEICPTSESAVSYFNVTSSKSENNLSVIQNLYCLKCESTLFRGMIIFCLFITTQKTYLD